MVLETQYIRQTEESDDAETEEEYPEFERLYVQPSDDQHIEEYEETTTDGPLETDEQNKEYEVAAPLHVTGF